MTFKRQKHVIPHHSAAIIRHTDQAFAAASEHHVNLGGSGVDGVFDQFFHGASWTLQHLASSDAVDGAF